MGPTTPTIWDFDSWYLLRFFQLPRQGQCGLRRVSDYLCFSKIDYNKDSAMKNALRILVLYENIISLRVTWKLSSGKKSRLCSSIENLPPDSLNRGAMKILTVALTLDELSLRTWELIVFGFIPNFSHGRMYVETDLFFTLPWLSCTGSQRVQDVLYNTPGLCSQQADIHLERKEPPISGFP